MSSTDSISRVKKRRAGGGVARAEAGFRCGDLMVLYCWRYLGGEGRGKLGSGGLGWVMRGGRGFTI